MLEGFENATGNTYDDSSVSSLKGADRVRKRPEVMLGTSDVNGARHGVIELMGNALDEATSGYGDRLELTYHKDKSITIRDYGRGVPLGWNEKEQAWNWHLIYNELYSGGKYEDAQTILKSINDSNKWDEVSWDYLVDNINYLFSIGLNGLGCASTQYSSEFFKVTSYRDGKAKTMEFKDGNPVLSDLIVEDSDEPTGTKIHWKPDHKVFSDVEVGSNWLKKTFMDTLAIAGVKLTFIDENEAEEIDQVDTGLKFVADRYFEGKVTKDKHGDSLYYDIEKFSHGIVDHKNEKAVFVCQSRILFTFLKEDIRNPYHCYHNNIKMDSGSQYSAIRMALENFFKQHASERGIKLEQQDMDNVIGVVVGSFANIATFKGQTKNEVHDMFLFDNIYSAIYDKLNVELGKNNPDILGAVETVISNAETRIQMKEYAKQIRKAQRVSREKPSKFVSCRAYSKKESSLAELWIAEGDSALGALKQARDSDYQALYPIRGKILNVLKASIGKIVDDQVISDLFSLLETGMDIGLDDEEDLFDIDKLRFDKIIIATDADKDGYQIRALLFVLFYKLAPELISQGKVFIADTPLFEIRFSDGDHAYALTLDEKDKIVNETDRVITGISRFKGLGETSPEVLSKTTVHPQTRNLIPLTMDTNDEFSRELIDALFGMDVGSQRKEILTVLLGGTMAETLMENEKILQDIHNTDYDEDVEYSDAV